MNFFSYLPFFWMIHARILTFTLSLVLIKVDLQYNRFFLFLHTCDLLYFVEQMEKLIMCKKFFFIHSVYWGKRLYIILFS